MADPPGPELARAPGGTGAPVEPRPAATVVLLRAGSAGLEALLTHRPPSMAFAGGAHVFPGGAVDLADSDPEVIARSVLSPAAAVAALGGDVDPTPAIAAHVAAIRELFEEAGILLADRPGGDTEASVRAARTALLAGRATFPALAAELDLRLRTDRLVPLSRWVTPAGYPRRFDARFFAADLPPGAEPAFEGGEVAAHAWLRPADALEAMADGTLVLWLPTSSTLQQLAGATSIDQIRERLAPGPAGASSVDVLGDGVVRLVMPNGGGVAGQPVSAYLVGRERVVLVDPGDPTGPALDRAISIISARGARIEGVALTHVDPDHAAGAEAIAESLGIPVFAGAGAGRSLPYAVLELTDLERLPVGDVPLVAVHTPGPRPDHLAFVIGTGQTVIAGDLDGVRGARMLPTPPDPRWAASAAMLRDLAREAAWLPGHPPVGSEV